jgi:hypothetical protein
MRRKNIRTPYIIGGAKCIADFTPIRPDMGDFLLTFRNKAQLHYHTHINSLLLRDSCFRDSVYESSCCTAASFSQNCKVVRVNFGSAFIYRAMLSKAIISAVGSTDQVASVAAN